MESIREVLGVSLLRFKPGYRNIAYDYQNNHENNNIYTTERKANKYYSNINYNNTDYFNKNANFKLEYVSSVNPRK